MKPARFILRVFFLPILASGCAQAIGSDAELIRQGREIYISEGCIHCHSQYVRPATPDVVRWGPAAAIGTVLAGEPPLLGNRRLGPDLANVGNRRSPEWNRLHLQDPRQLAPGSRMPSYAHLFRGVEPPGEALIAYLASLGAGTGPQRLSLTASWRPATTARVPDAGRFQQLCAECHGEAGRGDGPLAAKLSLPPADLTRSHWRRVQDDDPELELKLARIVKFGLPGSPMAGHEYLDDATVVALVKQVQLLHAARTPVSHENPDRRE